MMIKSILTVVLRNVVKYLVEEYLRDTKEEIVTDLIKAIPRKDKK